MCGGLAAVRVLIVEDEALIGMAVRAALQNAGAQAVFVQNDRAAYQLLEAEGDRLDVLIADINLREGTTGFDVSRFARRVNPSLAVIYLSGGNPNSATSFGVAGGEFVQKPIVEAELLSLVRRLSRGRGAVQCPMPAAIS